MMRRRGFTLLEMFIVLAIMALMVSILLPSLKRARELAKVKGAVAAGVALEPTIEGMEEAAEDASEEHDIYDRVVALTKNAPGKRLTIQVPHSSGIAKIRLWSDDDLEAVEVRISGDVVYKKIGDDIRTYLGMGEWEHLLGDIEQKVLDDREERFRTERKRRFGPLVGWAEEGQ